MDRNNLDEAIIDICEASGCQAVATEKLSLTAGPFGVITLELCPACVTKFAKTENDPTFPPKINSSNSSRGLNEVQ